MIITDNFVAVAIIHSLFSILYFIENPLEYLNIIFCVLFLIEKERESYTKLNEAGNKFEVRLSRESNNNFLY